MNIFSTLPAEKAVLFALEARGANAVPALHAGFEEQLSLLLEVRTVALDAHLESMRQAGRDMLRNGKFKPTGRSKPASEYLLNSALDGTFPRINALVDICNYISLKYLVPVSLWDLDKAGSDVYVFRLGKSGEQYIFNPSGQELDIQDLIIGYSVKNGVETPCVSPVKDSQATKTDNSTRNIGAVIYWPASYRGIFDPHHVISGFCELLQTVCGAEAKPVEVTPA
jgi:DNA/RNA-binding domain of Phe-tRNA-synthetase-like protein